MKRRIIILCALLFVSIVGFSQNSDSLKLALKNAKHDTTRCDILIQLIEGENDDLVWPAYNEELKVLTDKNLKGLKSDNPLYPIFKKHLASYYNNKGYLAGLKGESVLSIEYNQKSIDILNELLKTTKSKEVQDALKSDLATSINNIASSHKLNGNVAKTIECLEQSLKLQEEIDDKFGIARSLGNLAAMFDLQGDIPKSLEYNMKALKIREKIGDKDGIAYSFNNIGAIFILQNDYDKALEYFNNAYKLQLEINNKNSAAQTLNNIGYLNFKRGNLKLALDFYERSLKQRKLLQDKQGIAETLGNIGGLYQELTLQADLKNNPKAVDSLNRIAINYFQEALSIQNSVEDKKGAAVSMINIAEILYAQGNYIQAKEYGLHGLQLSQETGYPDNIKHGSAVLSRVYQKLGNFKEAYEMVVLHKLMADSINNENTKKASLQKSFQYEYDKKVAADSVRVEEERKVTAAQLKQERTQRFALYGGLALVLTFSIFIFNRFRITNRQKMIIENQKLIVDEKNLELNQQKQIIEEHQKEIVDSITYAKRIQEAILPPIELIKEKLPQSFVLYKPKDIVAGDFYWMEQIGDTILIAAADCTGHGVPGAMVSVVCSNALNRAVKEFHLSDTGAILDKVTDLVLETFEKSVAEVKDGMDISLLSINKTTKEIKWSGANNPLWYFEGTELKEITADKQPIGKSDHRKPFTSNKIEFKEGLQFYLFTDGYADQFGGPKGKKYKYKQFQETILSLISSNPESQKEGLNNSFESWKGTQEQVDDVCIIGVRL